MITLIFNANRIPIALSVLTLETTIAQMSTYIRPICYFVNFENTLIKSHFYYVIIIEKIGLGRA